MKYRKLLSKDYQFSLNKKYDITCYLDKPEISNFFDITIRTFEKREWFWIHFQLLGNILCFNVELTKKTDHAGFNFKFSFLGFDFQFLIYDVRHWDYDREQWEDDESFPN